LSFDASSVTAVDEGRRRHHPADAEEPSIPTQYPSIRYTNRLLDAGTVTSIGIAGTASTRPWPEPWAACTRPSASAATAVLGVDHLELAPAEWVSGFDEARWHAALAIFRKCRAGGPGGTGAALGLVDGGDHRRGQHRCGGVRADQGARRAHTHRGGERAPARRVRRTGFRPRPGCRCRPS